MLYLVSSVCYTLIKLGRNMNLCHATMKKYLFPHTERLADTKQGHCMGYSWRPFQTPNLGVSREQLETPNT